MITPRDEFSETLHTTATQLHDTGSHYLLSSEQFDAILLAADKYAEARAREERLKINETMRKFIDIDDPGNLENAKKALAALNQKETKE